MELSVFFRENPRVALAFSGGVDSAYLLYAGAKAGAHITAYYVKSEFQPAFELEDAKRLADSLRVPLRILELSVLDFSQIRENGSLRCYYCKSRFFSVFSRPQKQTATPW